MKAFCYRVGIIFLSLGLLSSCGKIFEKFSRLPSTTVKFTVPKGLTSTLDGHLMVYAIREDGGYKQAEYAQNEDTAEWEASMLLPNGAYRFYAVGFSSAEMQGITKCGESNNGNLTYLGGGLNFVSLDLNKDECASSAFSTADYVNSTSGVEIFSIASCATSVSLGALNYLSNCGAHLGNIHRLRSVQVVMYGYDQNTANFNGSEIRSQCFWGAGLPGYTEPISTATNRGFSVFALNDSTVFFGLDGGDPTVHGIHRSTDSGQSFTLVQAGENTQTPNTPTQNTTFYDIEGDEVALYAAGVDSAASGGIWESLDDGASWTMLTNTNNSYVPSIGDFYDLSVSGEVIIAASNTGHVLITEDGGSNWSDHDLTASNSMDDIQGVFYDADSDTYYAIGNESGSNVRVLKSIDSGATWSTFAGPYTAEGGTRLMVKKIGDRFFIGTGGGIRFSDDDGSTWTRRCKTGSPACAGGDITGLAGNNVFDIIYADGVYYTGGSDGVSYSDDDGDSWSSMNWGYGTGAAAYRVAYADGRLYSVETSAGVKSFRRSNNKGSGVAFATSGSPRIPVGSGAGSGFLATTIEVFSDPNCENYSHEYDFPNGLRANSSSLVKVDGSFGNPGRIFLVDQ
jgi:photosystem II stability/assembly factor-like uncharacterized protein